MSRVLEDRDRFVVLRLVSSSATEWQVDGIDTPKMGFETWLNALP